MTELCKGHKDQKQQDEENPFQRFIAQDLNGYLKTSRLVIFYHQNPAPADNDFNAFAMFKKENMLLKKYGRKTMEMAVMGTPYEAVLDFYVSHNKTLFCPEPQIKKVLKISKKFPHLVILGKFL